MIAACAQTSTLTKPPEPQEVIVRVESNQPIERINIEKPEGDGISRAMEVRNPDGELSGLSFVVDGVGYTKIFYGIGTNDTGNIWNDLIVYKKMGVKKVKLFINSPGGDAFQGLAIADHLKRASQYFDIEAHANGIVASAAVPILAACKYRIAAPGTVFMIHKASIFKFFGSDDKDSLEAQSKMLRMIRERYISNLPQGVVSAEEWENKINATTYFGTQEALEWGLVDKIE